MKSTFETVRRPVPYAHIVRLWYTPAPLTLTPPGTEIWLAHRTGYDIAALGQVACSLYEKDRFTKPGAFIIGTPIFQLTDQSELTEDGEIFCHTKKIRPSWQGLLDWTLAKSPDDLSYRARPQTPGITSPIFA